MYEQMPDPIDPDKLEGESLIQKGEEMAADFILRHPELVEPAKTTVESSPEIVELKGMIATFESKHSLEVLLAITDLTAAEAPNHPIREPARLDLNIIKEKYKYMTEESEEIKMHIKRLSQAVGIINSGKVDHTR